MYEHMDRGMLKETAELAIQIGQRRKEKLRLMREALNDGNDQRVVQIARDLCGLERYENTDTSS